NNIRYRTRTILGDPAGIQSLTDDAAFSVPGIRDVRPPNDVIESGVVGPQAVPVDAGGSSAIRAWHGSPSDFDKFSLRRVGSGEGAQGEGYGLYFGDKRAVGEYYRDNIPYYTEGHIEPARRGSQAYGAVDDNMSI